ncbi:MAG: sugar phosphate nucleotidyltransferase [Candidatus Firestonebacteria bacterium]
MRAIILAGGKGARLRPYTVVLPKPLMPIGEYSILEVVVRQLAYYGFTHITMAVNHQAEVIKALFRNGKKWGVKIDYSLEDMPLNTMGPLKLIKDLPENFLVMNGDVLTNLDFQIFYHYHVSHNHIFTISSYKREQKIEYGVLDINENNKLFGFREKPLVKYDVSMGIYMANRKALEYIPEDTPYGFDQLMLDLIQDNNPASVCRFDGYWLDIGRPDDYLQAIEEFETLKRHFVK